MALADTTKAIGVVSSVLKSRLDDALGLTTHIGRPSDIPEGAELSLFLYEISFDPHLKNSPLNEGEKPPLWIVLKYLLTAFDSSSTSVSDSVNAHNNLGNALKVIYTDDLLRYDRLSADDAKVLTPNPSPLHVTFDECSSDLVAKLMQGQDDKFRLSTCFQVRPVMIAAAEPGDFSLLVGVDYTKQPTGLAAPYVGIDVLPSMGAHIEEISPSGFEIGEEVTIRGTDMHLSDLSVMLGAVELPVTMQRPDELRFKVDSTLIGASGISAGSHPVAVVLKLKETGKVRKSNIVIGNLVPTLGSATVNGLVAVNAGPPKTAFATIDLAGVLLGAKADDVVLAFYRNGAVHKMFDVFDDSQVLLGTQTDRKLKMTEDDAVPAGDYNMILIVNGQQAPQSPLVHLDAP